MNIENNNKNTSSLTGKKLKYKKLLPYIFKGEINRDSLLGFDYIAIIRLNKILYFKNIDDLRFMFVHKYNRSISRHKSLYENLNRFLTEFYTGNLLIITDDLHINSLKKNFLGNNDVQTVPYKKLNFSITSLFKHMYYDLFDKSKLSRIKYTIDFTQTQIYNQNREHIYSSSNELKELIVEFENLDDEKVSFVLLQKIIRKRSVLNNRYKRSLKTVKSGVKENNTGSISVVEKIKLFFQQIFRLRKNISIPSY